MKFTPACVDLLVSTDSLELNMPSGQKESHR